MYHSAQILDVVVVRLTKSWLTSLIADTRPDCPPPPSPLSPSLPLWQIDIFPTLCSIRFKLYIYQIYGVVRLSDIQIFLISGNRENLEIWRVINHENLVNLKIYETLIYRVFQTTRKVWCQYVKDLENSETFNTGQNILHQARLPVTWQLYVTDIYSMSGYLPTHYY